MLSKKDDGKEIRKPVLIDFGKANNVIENPKNGTLCYDMPSKLHSKKNNFGYDLYNMTLTIGALEEDESIFD